MNFTRIALALNELNWRSSAMERSRVVFACRQTQQLYWAACAGAILRPQLVLRPRPRKEAPCR